MNPYPKTTNEKPKMGMKKLTHDERHSFDKTVVDKRLAKFTNRHIEQDVKVRKYPMKRTRIKPVSKKQAKENAELKKLVDKLRELSRVKRNVTIPIYQSELTGDLGDWETFLEPHHLAGRGKNLCNPFTIIMISRLEHLEEQKHMSYEHKQELINKIRQIRLAQGFKEEDYK